METHKNSAKIIGILFLVALIPNIIANEIINPVLASDEYLSSFYSNRNAVVIANLLNMVCGIAMILIPVVLLPLVKEKYNQLSIGYVIFRAIEGVLFFYIAIKTFSFIDLSKNFISSPVHSDIYHAIGQTTRAEIQWSTLIYLIAYSCGAIMFYYLLLKAQLVPKWLSVWGLISVIVLAVGPIMYLFELGVFRNSSLLNGMAYFAPPVALNEFVLSIWLIVRGLKTSQTPSLT